MLTVACLALLLLLPAVVGAVTGSGLQSGAAAGPCHDIVTGSATTLPPTVGVAMVGSELVDEFPPVNVTCVDGGRGNDVQVLGLFSEFADDNGTVAVLIAYDKDSSISLHPSMTIEDEWKLYLTEVFREARLTFTDSNESGDGLLAWFEDHSRAVDAQLLHTASERHEELAGLVARLHAARHRER